MTQTGDHSSRGSVNVSALLTRVENDHELLCELIGLFKEDFPRLIQSLEQSVHSEDMKNVEITSHTLKGMLSGLSVTQAAATALKLEQMGRDGKTSGLIDVLRILEHEVAGLLPELDAYAEEAKR